MIVLCLPQDSLDRIAPEGSHYRHDDEGSDDMPAHVKVRLSPELVASHCVRSASASVSHPSAYSKSRTCVMQSSLMGASLNVPVRQGQLAMGTWQGLYLNEHRNHGGSRKVCITIQGQKRSDGRKYQSSRW